MGLVIALALAMAVLIALWRLGHLDMAAAQLVGAALFLALAGYAWQGSPHLRGQAAAAVTPRAGTDSEFARTREALLGRFDRSSQWLTISGSYLRQGKTRDAVATLQRGTQLNPRDPDLWTGLGNALVAHADGLITPASELAFARATELAPDHPGPPFYRGLALAENGRFAEAETLWQGIVASAPPEAEYRAVVAQRLDVLRQIRAAIDAQQQHAPR